MNILVEHITNLSVIPVKKRRSIKQAMEFQGEMLDAFLIDIMGIDDEIPEHTTDEGVWNPPEVDNLPINDIEPVEGEEEIDFTQKPF